MHPLVPDFFIKRYEAGQMDGSFPAVGLFVDISGFSRMTDVLMKAGDHGAEVLAGVMRTTFTPLIRSVYEHGGFVASQAGDAFTALFPINTIQPGYPEQAQTCAHALAAAWDIHRHCERPQHTTPYGAFDIFNKVGLALGEVSWGIIESSDRKRAVVYFQGTAVDGCTHAEHHANAGQVILEGEFLTQVQETVSVEPLGEYYQVTNVGLMPLAQPAALPVGNMELAGRFYPRELLNWPHSGEFRQIVNLFISLPTVRNKTQLDIFMQLVFHLMDQYGGLLTHLDFGDKGTNLLLFWGAPVAYENDIQRTLDFVLSLQTQTEVPINAGITYRVAHAGYIGSEYAEEYTAFGRGVNLAARFMTSTQRGEIWVDEMIAQRVAGQYDLEERGALPFKGFAEPQKAFALYERHEAAQPAYTGMIIGRSTELAELARFVQPILENHYAGMMVVWGEPGIGKSRLVHEFTSQSAGTLAQPFQVFLAQTDEILREPFNPFRYWVRNHFGVSSQQVEARNKRSFNRKIDEIIALTSDRRLAAELDRTRSFLGALAGLFWPDSLYEQLDAQSRYENTQIALATLLEAESLRQPVVFLLEDAHWVDADTRTLLTLLEPIFTAEETRFYPIAILITTRKDTATQWIENLPHQSINLDGLSRSELAALAKAQLSGPAADSLIDALEGRAEGNPFFAEQILRYLQDSGLLLQSAEGWKIDHTSSAMLPSEVHAVLVARLDRLAREVKEVVLTAAILGREFEVRLLGQMLQDQRLPDKVALAEQEAVWFALNEIRYIFRHTLMRETAYAMQVQSQRLALHRLAFEALESLYSDELKLHYTELAFHAEQAGLVEPACTYLRLAGESAQEAYHNRQAAIYYTRAIDLTAQEDLTTRWDLLLARQNIFKITGEIDLQKQDLAALAELAEALNSDLHRARTRLAECQCASQTGNFQQAIDLAQQAIALFQVSGDQTGLAKAEQIMCWALVQLDQYVLAEKLFRQAVDQGLSAGDDEAFGYMLGSLGMAALRQGNLDQALAYHQQALDIFSRNGILRGLTTCLVDMGNISFTLGKDLTARQYWERSLALNQKIGFRSGEAIARSDLGVISTQHGLLQEARKEFLLAQTILRQIKDRPGESANLLNLGILMEAMGDYTQSRHYLEQALSATREVGSRWFEGYVLCSLGDTLTGLGLLDEAAAAYSESLELRLGLGNHALVIETQAGQARLYMAKQALPEALSLVVELMATLGELGPGVRSQLAGAEQPLRILLTCYQVLQAAGDGRAQEVLNCATAWLLDFAAGLPAEDRPAYLENISWNRVIYQLVN